MAPLATRTGIFALSALVALLTACGGSSDSAGNVSAAGASSGSASSSSGSSGSGSSASNSGTYVLTYHNDSMRTGQNLTETILTPGNVSSSTFGLLRILAADNPVDATPLIATKVSIGGSAHNVVYFATEQDTVYAYDADSGAALLKVSLLGSGETPSGTHSCGQVEPQIGVRSTAAPDPTARCTS
jgi:hypothetical protein